MKSEIEKEFIEAFPQLFKDMYGDPRETCMAWGISCSDGWRDLLWKMCEDIQEQLELFPEPDLKFSQVKEKFGGLRVYHTGTENDRIYQIIDAAEDESYKTCEWCGSKDNITFTTDGWITALCGDCHEDRKRQWEERAMRVRQSAEKRPSEVMTPFQLMFGIPPNEGDSSKE